MVKVMVIDDSRAVRRDAARWLTAEGFDVETAADAFEGMAVIASTRPQIIFLDAVMPVLSGHQSCALLKSNPKLYDTPVIVLAAEDGCFERARERLAGADGRLEKPLARDALVAAAKKFSRAANGRVAGPATVAPDAVGLES